MVDPAKKGQGLARALAFTAWCPVESNGLTCLVNTPVCSVDGLHNVRRRKATAVSRPEDAGTRDRVG